VYLCFCNLFYLFYLFIFCPGVNCLSALLTSILRALRRYFSAQKSALNRQSSSSFVPWDDTRTSQSSVASFYPTMIPMAKIKPPKVTSKPVPSRNAGQHQMEQAFFSLFILLFYLGHSDFPLFAKPTCFADSG
jgi:hypothetical protein